MVSGICACSLNETLGTINLPTVPQDQFSRIESKVGELWNECLLSVIMAAAAEERELAIQRGDFHGVPAITVLCDGGRSKRSYKHSYNAPGGVGVIFGAATRKILLYICVRNKHCYVCSTAEARKSDPPVHTCFRNWTQSSQSMEADIIMDGFCRTKLQSTLYAYNRSRRQFRFCPDSAISSHLGETCGKDGLC